MGWLLPRLDRFRQEHPFVELRLRTNNNVVNLAAEGLDFAIRFGTGLWPSTHNEMLFEAPLTVLCTPATAKRLVTPADLLQEDLLRSYRAEEWENWFAAAGLQAVRVNGAIFDSSRTDDRERYPFRWCGISPSENVCRELATAQLVRPFATEINMGSYWLTHLKSKAMTPAMEIFSEWLLKEAAEDNT